MPCHARRLGLAAFDGTSIWVANETSGSVWRINPTNNIVTAKVSVGSALAGVAFDGINIWVTHGLRSVSKINRTNNTVTATVSVGAGGDTIGVAFDGINIWVANRRFGTVSKIWI